MSYNAAVNYHLKPTKDQNANGKRWKLLVHLSHIQDEHNFA